MINQFCICLNIFRYPFAAAHVCAYFWWQSRIGTEGSLLNLTNFCAPAQGTKKKKSIEGFPFVASLLSNIQFNTLERMDDATAQISKN